MRPKEFHLHPKKNPVYTHKGEKFSEDYWEQDESVYAGDIPRLIERLKNEGEIDVQIITLYRVKGSDNWTENPEEILEDYAKELGVERVE